MKKHFLVILSLLFLSGVLEAQQPTPGKKTTGIVPSNAILYAESSELERFIPVASYVINTFLPEQNAKKVKDWVSGFKTKTGIDVLDVRSLASTELDVSREISLAYLKSERDDEKFLIVLPVKNEKTFPLRFVELMKKYNRDKQNLDLNPVVTQYKRHAVYQMLKDIFFTATGGCMLIAPSRNVITAAIDLQMGESAVQSLDADAMYGDFAAKRSAGYDVSVFARKEFFDELEKSKKHKDGDTKENDAGKIDETSVEGNSGKEDGNSAVNDETAPPDESGKEGKKKATVKAKADLEFTDYAGLGIKKEKDGITVQLAMSMKKDSQPSVMLTQLFRTGLPSGMLAAEKPLSYHYFACDLAALEKYCAGASDDATMQVCEKYAKSKAGIEKDLGFRIGEDLAPWFGGYFNIAMRKTRVAGTMDNFVFFVPLTDKSKAVSLWKKMKSASKDKYGTGQDRFGEEKIDAIPSFWYLDNKGNRISVIAAERGIYAGNNVEYLRVALGGKNEAFNPATIIPGTRLDESIFMFSYLKLDNDSYIKALLMLLTYQAGPPINTLVNRIDEIVLTGRRLDAYISLDITMKLLPAPVK
jgi:hypothetical protein